MNTFAKDNYQILIEKLDAFIRKYYINQIIRGSLYFLALILLLFISFSLLEYYFYFSSPVRKTMFYSFLGVSLISGGVWIVQPLVHYFRLGSIISHEQAAGIIGNHFSDINDKLLNVLQLKQQSFNVEQRELIEAGIQQKTQILLPMPFRNAINLYENKKYLRLALPPFFLLVGILLVAPHLISESSERIIQNNREFERKAPFSFIIVNDKLEVANNEDFTLLVSTEGEALPNDVFIAIGEYQYRMTKNEDGRFEYTFKNVSRETTFRFYAAGFYSTPYTLALMKKPGIRSFELRLVYPAYTLLKPDVLTNVGDFTAPAGTRAEWVVETDQTEALAFEFGEKKVKLPASQTGTQQFTMKQTVMQTGDYRIFLNNTEYNLQDSIQYRIQTIADQFPEIQVETFKDSLSSEKILYFAGTASDDYGVKTIFFKYQIHKHQGGSHPEEKVLIASPNIKKTDYKYVWDYSNVMLEPGDRVSYYFEAGDNDGVNGTKYARTAIASIERPTLKEIEAITEKNSAEIKETLSQTMKEARKIQQEIKQLRDKLLQQKEMDWQRKKDLEKLLEKQKELEEKLKETKEKFQENKENIEENQNMDERFEEKQEKLEELFEKVVDPETQELMDKIQQMMRELNKDNALQMMEQMQNKNSEKEMELDRLMELYKNLELEYDMKQQSEALEKLAEEQEKLARETEKNDKSAEELKKEQEELNKKFDELNKKMDDIQKKNQDLERPKDLEDIKNDMDNIQKDMDKSKEELGKKNTKNAQQRQKDAAKKMKELAEKMGDTMESGEMEQMEEDMRAMRQLLENILTLSFKQEDVIQEFNRVNNNTPAYVRLVQEQAKIRDNFKMVEDSLHALSKRVFQLESFITEKTQEIRQNVATSISKLEDRKKHEAADNQQRTMKNLNDLALMLNETMEQMQQDMANMMPGTQMCKKPGSSKGNKPGSVPMDKITEGQKGVTEQMKKLKEGRDKGEMQPGEQSKQFAEIAAQQAALRKALEQLQKEKQERGKGDKGLQEIIDQMNKNEIDLVNKRLTNETLKRQQNIITRLLEADKAEREQDWDDKRKAERPNDVARQIPPAMEEYLKKRMAETESYKTIPPSVQPFYKSLIEQYYQSIEK
jgi:hypothetical protein